MVVSPVLSRLYAEWLNPVIKRVYKWMLRKNMVSPPPVAMGGSVFKVNYVSPMAVSRKASVSQSFMAAMSATQMLLQVDPGVMQNLDVDGVFRSIMAQNNVDPTFLKTEREVEQMRQQQAQQQQQEMQAAQAQQMASAAKDSASAAVDLGSMGGMDVGI